MFLDSFAHQDYVGLMLCKDLELIIRPALTRAGRVGVLLYICSLLLLDRLLLYPKTLSDAWAAFSLICDLTLM